MTRFLHKSNGHPDGPLGAAAFFISPDNFVFELTGGAPWYWIAEDGWLYPSTGHPEGQSSAPHFWIADGHLYPAPSRPGGGAGSPSWYYIADAPP
jgi:hypothetical protein